MSEELHSADKQNENRLGIFKQGVQDKLTSPIDIDK